MTVIASRQRRRGLAALLIPLLATLLVGAAVALGTAAVPAQAAGGYCTGAGVNVVVDFTGQGGGIAKGCATRGAGGNAWDAFEAAGFPLTPVQRYPGAVCRVSGRPADVSCQGMPPADAYWGFFTSHGGGWSYASVGPSSYRVEDGDTVGFAWQSGSKRQPAAAPAAPRPTPSPTAHPTAAHSPGEHPSDAIRPHPSATTTSGSAPSTPAPSGAASLHVTASASAAPHHAKRHRHAARAHASHAPEATASASATPSPSAEAAPAIEPASAPASDEGGMPWWVPVIVIVLLGGAGAALAMRRRTAGR